VKKQELRIFKKLLTVMLLKLFLEEILMADNMDNNLSKNQSYDELEIDLREYITLLWQKKWFIIALVVAAVLIGYFYTVLTTEVKYEARSEILLMPPRYTEIEVSGMGRSTYAHLAKTDDILSRIIEELDIRDRDNELIHPAKIENNLELEIMEDEEIVTGETSFLLTMKVKRTDPEEASEIANLWAELFKDDTLAIRLGEVEDIFEVTKSRFEETEENLQEAQSKLRDFKQEARLEQLQARKDAHLKQQREYLDKIIKLEDELALLEASKSRTEGQLADLEIEGEWSGELARIFRGQEVSDRTADYFQASQNWVEAELRWLQKELDELEKILAEEPEKFVLDKNMLEEALWENILNPEELEVLSELVLQEEVVNPTYEYLRQEYADLKRKLYSQPEIPVVEDDENFFESDIKFNINNEEDFLNKEASKEDESNNTKSILVEEFDNNAMDTFAEELLADFSSELDLLQHDVVHYQELYQQESERYRELKDDLIDKRNKIANLEEEFAYFINKEVEVEESINNLEDRFWTYQDEIANLEREIKRYENSYDELSSQIEEARLAMAEQTSDVRFVSAAVPPGRRIGRGTTLNMAIAAVLAGMLGVFGVFFQEFMKEE